MADTSNIQEHMEVLGSDRQHVGTVDHMDGTNRIKLTKGDPADAKHHYISTNWIDHVDTHVHLNKSGADVRKEWQTA